MVSTAYGAPFALNDSDMASLAATDDTTLVAKLAKLTSLEVKALLNESPDDVDAVWTDSLQLDDWGPWDYPPLLGAARHRHHGCIR